MAYTHTQTRSVSNNAGRTITGTKQYTGDSEDVRELVLANDPTQLFPCGWIASGLQSFVLKSTIAATITIYDDENDNIGSVVLAAGTPYQWGIGDPGSAPISGDATHFNVSSAAVGALQVEILQNSGLSGVAALTGTFLTTPTESEVVTGGQTIIITLTNATWAAAGAAFNAQRAAILDGITSAQAEAAGWNAQVKAAFAVTDVVRDSATQVTVTLPATAGYSVTANEEVTVTVPSAATSAPTPIVATPTITIVANS